MSTKHIRATAKLFLDTKSAQSDAAKFVEDIRSKLTSIETAADKMTVFKDVVSYIGQIDRALSMLQKNNPSAFQTMFSGLDQGLRQQLESVFGTSNSQLNQIDVLREKLNTLTPQSGIAALREFAIEINNLFLSLGAQAPFENVEKMFANKATEDHIRLLTDAVSNFATVWSDTGAKVQQGFALGGAGSGVPKLSEEIQMEIERLRQQQQEYQRIVDLMNNNGAVNVDLVKGSAGQIEQLRALKAEFNSLHGQMSALESTKNTGGEQYLMTMSRYIETAAKVKSTFEHSRLSDAGMDWVNTNGLETLDVAERALSNFYNHQQSTMMKIQQLYSMKITGIDDQIAYLTQPYETLSAKLQEYAGLQNQLNNNHSLTDGDEDQIYRKTEAIEKYILSLDAAKGKQLELTTILGDLSFGDITQAQALQQICDLLGVQIPDAAKQAHDALSTSGSGVTTGNVDQVEQAKAKLQEYKALINEIQGQSLSYSPEGSIGIERYVERINAAKIELDSLGKQGLVTAEELAMVQNGLDSARNTIVKFQADGAQIEAVTSRLQQLTDTALSTSDQTQLTSIVQERQQLLAMAEETGLLNQSVLESEKAITAELEKRISLQGKTSTNTQQTNTTTQDAYSSTTSSGEAISTSGNVGVEIQQLQLLKSVLIEVEQAVQSKTRAFLDEANVVEQSVNREVDALRRLAETLSYIKVTVDTINGSGFINTSSNMMLPSTTDVADIDATTNTAAQAGYALESTLQATNNILQSILSQLSGGSFNELIEPLRAAALELQNVANGIVGHQKAQQTDRTAASVKIAGNYGQLSSIASNAVVSLGEEAQIQQMKALADGVVRVEGAVKNAEGVWKGFIVDINESNDAVIRSVSEQSAFASALNNSAEAAKNVSDATKNMKDQNGISSAIGALDQLKDVRSRLNTAFKGLDFSSSSSNLTESQQEILGLREQVLVQLDENKSRIQEGKAIELEAINTTMSALQKKINLYRETNNVYGDTATINAQARYKSLQAVATSPDSEFSNSAVVQSMFQQYEAAYNRLIQKRAELASAGNTATDSQKAEFRQLQQECSAYARELERVIQSSQKLASGGLQKGMIGADFVDSVEGRKAALSGFVKEFYNMDMASDSFTNNFNACTFAVRNADGTFTQMTATINAARTAIVSTAGSTRQATGAFTTFMNGMKQSFTNVLRYVTTFGSVYRLFSIIRQGITYIRDIDTALTELKKVTDETDESYSHFLDTMSKSATVVGSTIKDLTNSAADWARLGYSMQEAGKLAENTAVLLNVSEFDDVSKATDTLISALQAFKTEGTDVGDFSMQIIDKYNEVGNNYAISTSDLADSLTRSSAALVAANNSLEESIAMTAAANTTIQNPESVGNALKVVSMRIRGVKTELEEAGEDTEGMITNTAKLQEKIMALTDIDGSGGIDILTNSGDFKSTYEILLAISKVWEDMSDINQAALLEAVAGKTRGSVVAALFQNGDVMENAFASATNASGSAKHELNTYLDSIEGRVKVFTNQVQSFWHNLISAPAAKGIVNIGTKLIKLLDTVGLFPSILSGILVYLTAIKKVNFGAVISDGVGKLANLGLAQTNIKSIQAQNIGLNGQLLTNSSAFNAAHISDYASAVSNLKFTTQAAILAENGLSEAHIRQVLTANEVTTENIDLAMSEVKVAAAKESSTVVTGRQILNYKQSKVSKLSDASINVLLNNTEKDITLTLLDQMMVRYGLNEQDKEEILLIKEKIAALREYKMALTGLGPGLKMAWKSYGSMVVLFAGMALANMISDLKTVKEKSEELADSYRELTSSISELEGEISTFESDLSDLQEQIDELESKDKLSLTEAEELSNLKAQSAELEHQKELREHLIDMRDRQEEVKSLQMINNLLSTTAANQQEAAEKSAKAWKTTLAILLGVGGAVLGLVTGGSAWVITSAIAGGMIGGAIGEKIGYAGSMSINSVGTSLIDWYESYEKAIKDAEAQASEAESKYLSNVTDDNYKKWQDKVNAANTLQTELYDGLQAMGEYVENLDYNSETSHIINGYNELMAELNARSLDGNIEGQVESIQALEAEFKELSRGVDEYGNNVTLSSDEYARYNSIVKQVLSYQSGLVQSYNDVGDAILYASGKQFGFNELISASIVELRKHKQEAALEAIGDEGIASLSNTLTNTLAQNLPVQQLGLDSLSTSKNIAYYEEKKYRDPIEYSGRYTASHLNYVLNDIIGGKIDTYSDEGFIDYIDQYGSDIVKNRDTILQQFKDRVELNLKRAHGDSFADINELVQAADQWMQTISSAYSQVDTVRAQASATLSSSVPVASDYYYDLSGEQLRWINSYIDKYVDANINSIEDVTEEKLKTMVASLSDTVDKLATDAGFQKVFQDLFTLDERLTIDAWSQQIDTILNQALSDGAIDSKAFTEFKKVFATTSDDINKMIESVGVKMTPGLQENLKSTLNKKQLEIAYEATKDVEDASLSYLDLMRLIEQYGGMAKDVVVQSHSTLQEQAGKLNDIMSQTSEIVLDNTEVTQEYKDSLVELGISEDELAECFDVSNDLVVANAAGLQELVNSVKDNAAQNAKLAKSQARLQYYELFKEMNNLIGANGTMTDAQRERVLAIYDEMNALENTIARYSILEATLLGATDAYDKLADAQEVDEAKDYGSKAEELVNILGEAFNTAKLGTEAAQVAFKGLIPDEVFADIDTLDGKMQKAYEYFTSGTISKLFTIEFDDDGGISSVEMAKENIEEFTKSLIDLEFVDQETGEVGTVFQGSWDEFGLNSQITTLKEFADAIGSTEEVAFAFLTELENYDISWLGGDYSTFLDQFLNSTTEGQLQLYSQKIADLNAEYAELQKNGKSLTDEQQQAYQEKYSEYIGKYNDAKTKSAGTILGADGYIVKTDEQIAGMSLDDIDNYIDAQTKVSQAEDKVTEALQKQQEAYEALQKDPEDQTLIDKYNTTTIALMDLNQELAQAIAKKDTFEQPGEVELQLLIETIDSQIDEEFGDIKEALDSKLLKYYEQGPDGVFVLRTGMSAALEKDANYKEIVDYVNLLNSRTQLVALANTEEAEEPLQLLQSSIDQLVESLKNIEVALCGEDIKSAKEEFTNFINGLPSNIKVGVALVKDAWNWLTGNSGDSKAADVNGTAHAQGTAFAGGSWGTKKTEEALVGELGPEILVDSRTGTWRTIGERGAEFINVPRGSIIFNHKQSEQLLKNGHITSRGKAYALGTTKNSGAAYAYAIGATTKEDDKIKKEIKETIKSVATSSSQYVAAANKYISGASYDAATVDTFDDAYNNLSSAYQGRKSSGSGSGSDSAEEFAETFDWIEIRLEEINEQLDLMNAQIENAVGYANKNNIIDNMLDVNKSKANDLEAGIKKYASRASKLLSEIPTKYRDMAQDGSIAITEFAGEADEATVESINNYRDWAQKVTDLQQQLEEVNSELRDLAKQKFDNIVEAFDNITDISDHKKDKIDDAISLMEDSGNVAASAYYEELIKHDTEQLSHLNEERQKLINSLNKSVEEGYVEVGDSVWYEMQGQIYDVDHAIDECTANLEEYQNSINDIYWDNFDELVNRLDYIRSETENLVKLFEHDDLISEPDKKTYKGGTEEYWTADDVELTKEGIVTLGLYSQQMELAEYESKQYGEAIAKLTADYKNGLYSESEYYEKLNELTEAQYDSIESYHDAKDAIVDLNKERIESIKSGIDAEIDAYGELIDKKKELLENEKDLYDFQKNIAGQQKDIASIQRKLAALANDNSSSAIAQRKKLEQELAEANAQLEETYYDRSITNQQDALDKSLENFKEEKDAEKEAWDEYLDDIEAIVADSLQIVAGNAVEIGNTLTGKAEEYNVTISEAILTPWQSGVGAISEYTTVFGDSSSATLAQLDAIKNKWQEIIDKMLEAAKIEIAVQQRENSSYSSATKKEPAKTTTSSTSNKTQSTTTTKAVPSVGSTVTVKTSATHFSANSGNLKMASFVPGGSYTVYETEGDQVLIGKGGAYTGWVKKTDLQYAKGTLGVEEDQIALIDELGEELVMHADGHGRLAFLSKGTSVVPHDITANLMKLGQLDPSEVLDRNRAAITVPHITNNEINISMDIAEVVHIDKVTNDTIPNLTKAIEKQMDAYVVKLNNSLKRFSR